MDTYLLELSRSQLIAAWNKSRFNKYSDNRKALFHESLNNLYSKLFEVDFEKVPEFLHPIHRDAMNFFCEKYI